MRTGLLAAKIRSDQRNVRRRTILNTPRLAGPLAEGCRPGTEMKTEREPFGVELFGADRSEEEAT